MTSWALYFAFGGTILQIQIQPNNAVCSYIGCQLHEQGGRHGCLEHRGVRPREQGPEQPQRTPPGRSLKILLLKM